MNCGEKLYMSLSLLLKTVEYIQNQIMQAYPRSLIATRTWMNDYCRIKMGSTRQSGHNYAIAKLIASNAYEKVLYISTLGIESRQHIKEELKKHHIDGYKVDICLSCQHNLIRDDSYDLVVINPAHFMSNK